MIARAVFFKDQHYPITHSDYEFHNSVEAAKASLPQGCNFASVWTDDGQRVAFDSRWGWFQA